MILSFRSVPVVRITLVVSAAVALGFLLSDSAFAQVYNGPGLQGGLGLFNGAGGITSSSDVKSLIIKIVAFLLDIVLTLAVVAVIVAGIYLIVSNGDDAQKDKAKKIIYYAIIGIILILLARVIVTFVNRIFG